MTDIAESLNRRRLFLLCVACFLIIQLAGCSVEPAQPSAFKPTKQLLLQAVPNFRTEGSALLKNGRISFPAKVRLESWNADDSLQLRLYAPLTGAELLQLRINNHGWILKDHSRKQVVRHTDKLGQSLKIPSWMQALNPSEMRLLLTGRLLGIFFQSLPIGLNDTQVSWQRTVGRQQEHNTIDRINGLPQQWKKKMGDRTVLRVVYEDYREYQKIAGGAGVVILPRRISIYARSQQKPDLRLVWQRVLPAHTSHPPRPFLSFLN